LSLQPLHLRVRDYPFIDNYFMSEDVWLEKKTKYSPKANQSILDQIERGQLLWEYYGHGAPNVFAEQRIFFGGGSLYSDVKRLHNRPYLPVLVALTCDTIQYDYSGEVGPQWTLCMGEELLTHPGGGAVAVYGSTGRGYTTQHSLLNDGFHDALFIHGFRTLGELVALSKLFCYAEQRQAEPLEMFGLLGDILTCLPVPEATVPVRVEPEAVAVRPGDSLDIRMDYPDLPSRRLRSLRARLSVQDAQGNLLFEREDRRLRGRRMRFRVAVPEDVPGGPGRVSAFLYPESSASEHGSYFGGGTRFQVLPQEETFESPEGALADLAVSATSIEFSPESPRSGETIFIDVGVSNLGQAPARQVEVKAYSGPPDAGGVALEDRAGWIQPKLPLIPPGQTRHLRLRWDPFQNDGKQDVYVQVDPSNRVAESSEDNNSASASLHVRKKIDLALDREDFQISPSEDPPGYLLRAAVRNIGETPAEPFLIQIFAYQTDDPGEIPREYVIEPDKTLPIPPKRRAKFPVQLEASTLHIEIAVDPDEILDEETHKNNRLALRVSELLSSPAQLSAATP